MIREARRTLTAHGPAIREAKRTLTAHGPAIREAKRGLAAQGLAIRDVLDMFAAPHRPSTPRRDEDPPGWVFEGDASLSMAWPDET
ncbi:MAG: hypothetical protein F4052_08560 [Dehalococcoidia bacterium]|nr:hypothetical protein [Dehalococcoidia bacterium]MYK26978.1 hypothetical protein [Dehalococcoidia bacterium]